MCVFYILDQGTVDIHEDGTDQMLQQLGRLSLDLENFKHHFLTQLNAGKGHSTEKCQGGGGVVENFLGDPACTTLKCFSTRNTFQLCTF